MWPGMTMNLFGGLALFLFGMNEMAEALKAAAGAGLKQILARLTTNRFTAALTGTIVTAVIQSSSVTTVLVVGFVSAGTMSLTQSIGVIMGANVGTTVTAQILAFKVTEYALLLVAAGFAALFAGKSERTRQYGKMVLGLGLIFLGMTFMGEAMVPLRTSPLFAGLMQAMGNPAAGVVAGALVTALLQSSSATTGIVVVMASQGLITLPAGIALALGANVGTCATAMLAAIGKPVEARRAALVHLLFNIAGALLWVGFIGKLAAFAIRISPQSPGLAGMERLAAETPRQIANANTLFNLANTLFFLPLAGVFGGIVTRLVPERPAEAVVKPKYLDAVLVSTPSLALARVRLELGHMGEIVEEMFRDLRNAFTSGSRGRLREVARHDEAVDILEESIVEYLSLIRKGELTERESDELGRLMAATAFMENLGDLVESEMVPLGEGAIEENLFLRDQSEAVRGILATLYEKVLGTIHTVTAAVRDGDEASARKVLERKPEIDGLAGQILARQSRELSVSGTRDFRTFRYQMELLERLRRAYALAKRLARTVLHEEGSGEDTAP